jgi:spermidine synthase
MRNTSSDHGRYFAPRIPRSIRDGQASNFGNFRLEYFVLDSSEDLFHAFAFGLHPRLLVSGSRRLARGLIRDIVHAVTNESLLRTLMDPWITIERATIPGSDTELTLLQRNEDFAIRIAGQPGDLMNSRTHHSEEALAELACTRLGTLENARILVGGLGMGFTLAAALRIVPGSAEVVVAELVPEVVEWNRGILGQCAGRPMDDSRTRVHLGDVADLIRHLARKFDAILLDVDNGPDAMTASANEWLYSPGGLRQIYEQLQPEGIVAIWSARADQRFASQLKKSGFKVQLRTVRARPGKGSRHTIFVAQKPGMSSAR